MATDDELEELSELAFSRLAEAVRKGTISLDGKKIDLQANEIIRVCQIIGMAKVKRPRPVSLPEDFKLHSTLEGEDDE